MKKKIVATIQARLGSTRFPKKVMKMISGKTIIEILVDRLKKSKFIDQIVLATTSKNSDKPLIQLAKKIGINYFAGSETDVLNRVTQAINKSKAHYHVECFGDSPFIDVDILDEFIRIMLKKNLDFVTNSIKTTFPPGSEILVYKSRVINNVNNLVKCNDPLREHAGYNITRFKKLFKIHNISAPKELNFPNIYIELDTKKDFFVLSKIYKNFKYNYFSLLDILNFFKKNKKLAIYNSKVIRNWKLLRNEKN